jgi:hypothetical protein
MAMMHMGEVMLKSSFRSFGAVAIVLMSSMLVLGQSTAASSHQTASIVGTATDVNGDPVPGAIVILQAPQASGNQNVRSIVVPESGYFEFHDVPVGTPYQINITSKDFADWTSPAITLEPGQFKIVTGIELRVRTEQTSVQVTYDRLQVATEQFRATENQRIFGFVPNFYVAYDKNAEPLTAKMKFKLALKISVDPITAAGVLFVASAKQAANSPRFGQGWGPYGERVGAITADGFSDIMIGGAILPSLLHQDPRYFYQGTGTNGSRIRHAVFSPFVARGDNGKWQPNYSSVGGDLGAAGIANLYYPASNRGAGLVFGNFALGTAERIGANLAQEFLFAKFTRRGGHVQ